MSNLGEQIVWAAYEQGWTVLVERTSGDTVLVSPHTGAVIEIDGLILATPGLRPFLVAILDRAVEDGLLIWPWPPQIPYQRDQWDAPDR